MIRWITDSLGNQALSVFMIAIVATLMAGALGFIIGVELGDTHKRVPSSEAHRNH